MSDVSVRELLHFIFDAGSVKQLFERVRPKYINRKLKTFERFWVVQQQNEPHKSVSVKIESRDRSSLETYVNLLMFNPIIYFQYYRVLHHYVTWDLFIDALLEFHIGRITWGIIMLIVWLYNHVCIRVNGNTKIKNKNVCPKGGLKERPTRRHSVNISFLKKTSASH